MRKRENPSTAGRLRIIGGEWRGRVLQFPAVEGLRPTTDRIRETLFNWLAPRVQGARCLDMFAGSGALGLEALSRGAAHCDFLELNPSAARQLEHQLKTLDATDRGHVATTDALKWRPDEPYDIVFVDPPYALGLAPEALDHLIATGLLAEDARVFVETGVDQPALASVQHLEILREKRAGDVRYCLLAPA